MPTLTLNTGPVPILGLANQPQLCYVLATIGAPGQVDSRLVNWALVADASRSMRIPIVSERQFRAMVRDKGAQETLVDGVPVWQLAEPVPPDIKANAQSALDHVAHALHSIVERLDPQDRFALVACAEEALLLAPSTSGGARVELVNGIARLKSLNLGEQTNLAKGMMLGLGELRRGRDGSRANRLLLLTDGFTQHPEMCIELANTAAAEGVTVTTVGLGGEFQEDVLTALADRSGGRALFLHKPDEIPRAIAVELEAARTVAARAVDARLRTLDGIILRRVTRIRPVLSVLYEQPPGASEVYAGGAQEVGLHLGDIERHAQLTLLLEFLIPPRPIGRFRLGHLMLSAGATAAVEAELDAIFRESAPGPAPQVLDAAARSSALRLQRRAAQAAAAGNNNESARLLRAAAARFDDLGEQVLAEVARNQATSLEQTGKASPLETKELTYATRRLGGETA